MRLTRTGLNVTEREPPRLLEGVPLPPLFLEGTDEAGRGYVGFWYELIEGERVIFRASGADPTGATLEYPADGGIAREKNAESVDFDLVVPLDAALSATELRIYSQSVSLDAGSDELLPMSTRIQVSEEALRRRP